VTLRIGLIGCGRATERLHLPALARVREASVVAVTDELPARRELIGRAVAGARVFDSVDDLLGRGSTEAVIVATPPETHRAVVDAVLRAGLPVLVEKPLAATLADALAMQATHDAHPAPLMVGFNRRFLQPVVELRSILRARPEEIGIEMIMTSDVAGWSAISGVRDPLDDLGSHQLDLLRFLFGPVVSVAAERVGEHEALMRVRVEGGVSATCRVAQTTTSEERVLVARGGARYSVRMGSSRLQPAAGAVRGALDLADRVARRACFRPSPMARSYVGQLLYFVDSVREGRRPQPALADGIAVLRAVEAARESAERGGREVRP